MRKGYYPIRIMRFKPENEPEIFFIERLRPIDCHDHLDWQIEFGLEREQLLSLGKEIKKLKLCQ